MKPLIAILFLLNCKIFIPFFLKEELFAPFKQKGKKVISPPIYKWRDVYEHI